MEQIVKFISDNLVYVWFTVLAMWGGTANYMSRINRDKGSFSIVELIGEWAISGFAGLITAYACTELELSFAMTSAAAGIGGHMGGRAIYLFEQIFMRRTGGEKE